jgi:hypothetical protein
VVYSPDTRREGSTVRRKSGVDQETRILTRHPEGKQGVNISRDKYEAMRAAIVRSVKGRGEVPLQAVREDVDGELRGRFEGSVSWYFTTVKLDLEARGILERVPGKRPQRVRLREVHD